MQFSHNYTYIAPLLSLPPLLPSLWVITEHQAGLPVLYSSFSPAVCFAHGNVGMLMLPSPFISLLPLLCRQVHYLYLCLHCFPTNKFISVIFLDSVDRHCCCSVAQSCLILCDPMDCSTPGFPVHPQLPEHAQTHVHRGSDAIQPSHPLLSPSPPAFNLSQHQGLFQ